MKYKIIEYRDVDNRAHFNIHWWFCIGLKCKVEFYVYRVSVSTDGYVYYHDKTDPGDEMMDTFDPDKAVKRFEGSICWRGDWDNRIYFTDDEYWAEELEEMQAVYVHVRDILQPLINE